MEELGLKGSHKPLCLSWSGGQTRKEESSTELSITVSGLGNVRERHRLPVVRTVRSLALPSQSVDEKEMIARYQHLRKVPVQSYQWESPRLLIGIDNYRLSCPLKTVEGAPHEPVATKTRLGWVVSGICKPYTRGSDSTSSFLHHIPCSCNTRPTLAKAPLQQPAAEMERKPSVVPTIWTTHNITTTSHNPKGMVVYPEKKRRLSTGGGRIPDGVAAGMITAASTSENDSNVIYESIINTTASGPVGATKVSTMPQSRLPQTTTTTTIATTAAVAAAASRHLYRQPSCHGPQRRQPSARASKKHPHHQTLINKVGQHLDVPAARTTSRLERLTVNKVSKIESAPGLRIPYATGHFKRPSGHHVGKACKTDEVSRNWLIVPVDSEPICPPARICDGSEADSTPGGFCSDNPSPAENYEAVYRSANDTNNLHRGSWPKERRTRAKHPETEKCVGRTCNWHPANHESDRLSSGHGFSLSHKSADLAVTRGPVLLDRCLRYPVT